MIPCVDFSAGLLYGVGERNFLRAFYLHRYKTDRDKGLFSMGSPPPPYPTTYYSPYGGGKAKKSLEKCSCGFPPEKKF